MKTKVLILSGTLLVLCTSGCKVDLNYDLSNLDTEITVLKGTTYPFPSPKPITLADIIGLEDNPYVTVDANGDYILSFTPDPAEITVMIPDYVSVGGKIPTGFTTESFSFTDIPDFLSSETLHVEPDLSDLVVDLSIDSDIPAVFSLSSHFETFRKGALQRSYLIDNLQVPYGNTRYVLRESTDGSAGSVQVPELGKLLSPVPDEFRISEMDVYALPEELAKVTPGDVYDLTFTVSMRTPVSFSENSRFTAKTALDTELNLKEVGLKKAALHMDLENTIPLDFSVNLYALDGDGKRIDTIQFSNVGSEIIPGQATCSPCLYLTTKGDLRFAGLVLELTASSSKDLAGIHFNRSQAIRFSNMYLELPDGIQVRMDKSGDN